MWTGLAGLGLGSVTTQGLSPSSLPQGLGPFLEAPSQELWCPVQLPVQLLLIKLQPKPVSDTLWAPGFPVSPFWKEPSLVQAWEEVSRTLNSNLLRLGRQLLVLSP